MNELGCAYDKSNGGLFVWAQIPPDEIDGEQYTNWILRELKLFLSPGFIFGSNGDRFIRASLCVQNTALEKAIDRVIEHKKI